MKSTKDLTEKTQKTKKEKEKKKVSVHKFRQHFLGVIPTGNIM